jgi:hypothetical protein
VRIRRATPEQPASLSITKEFDLNALPARTEDMISERDNEREKFLEEARVFKDRLALQKYRDVEVAEYAAYSTIPDQDI